MVSDSSEPATPGPLGEYPTVDGDVSDVGRRQQVAVAVWILGWLGGPLPALMALVVTRPGPGSYRRLLVAAAAFWTTAALLAVALVVGAGDRTGRLVVGWSALSLVGLAATALAIRRSLRGVR